MPDTAITRRSFMTGAPAARHHISSAVVVAFPERREDLSARLTELAGVEVHAGEGRVGVGARLIRDRQLVGEVARGVGRDGEDEARAGAADVGRARACADTLIPGLD